MGLVDRSFDAKRRRVCDSGWLFVCFADRQKRRWDAWVSRQRSCRPAPPASSAQWSRRGGSDDSGESDLSRRDVGGSVGLGLQRSRLVVEQAAQLLQQLLLRRDQLGGEALALHRWRQLPEHVGHGGGGTVLGTAGL